MPRKSAPPVPVRGKITLPPPPPPRITSRQPPTTEPIPDRVGARRRIVAIAAGEYAHVVGRKPRASASSMDHARKRLSDLVTAEVIDILVNNTDGDTIGREVAMLVSQAALEGFRLGVQHEASR